MIVQEQFDLAGSAIELTGFIGSFLAAGAIGSGRATGAGVGSGLTSICDRTGGRKGVGRRGPAGCSGGGAPCRGGSWAGPVGPVADEESRVEDLEQEGGQGQVSLVRGENPP